MKTIVDFRKATKALESVMGRLIFCDQWGQVVVDSLWWDADGNVVGGPFGPAPEEAA